jgi:hypothetical protein
MILNHHPLFCVLASVHCTILRVRNRANKRRPVIDPARKIFLRITVHVGSEKAATNDGTLEGGGSVNCQKVDLFDVNQQNTIGKKSAAF